MITSAQRRQARQVLKQYRSDRGGQRKERLLVCLSVSEKELLEALAESRGMTFGGYLLWAAGIRK